jgi:hypothetical protein
MKKIYVTPVAEQVKVKLSSGVLDNIGFGERSDRTGIVLGKEQDDFFETDGSFGDIWDDGGDSSNPYDLWDE